ncbi:MAG: heavy metal-binding domain-containing protein, partial [Pseudomonadota bacterium]|nr:heavy metal-binding domain-containing protein [Pseudomonadota bacterium]
MTTDPVCGMQVDGKTAKYQTSHKHKNYVFCSQHCLNNFKADPQFYLNKPETDSAKSCCSGKHDHQPNHDHHPHAQSGAKGDYICPMCEGVRNDGPGSCPKCGMALEPENPVSTNQKTEYTCPMHPEVIQDEPGDCPICGMALEATTVDVEPDNSEYKDMLKRFIVGGLLALPVFFIAMLLEMAPSLFPVDTSIQQWHWAEFILATPVVFWA